MPDHKKTTAKEKILERHRTQTKSEDESTATTGKKYDPASLRANMATGGGTPIPKGHKRTTEHRVLQPRDPDTGHFTYNADAELSLKYKSHGKANADPVGLKRFHLDKGVKKGDVVNISGRTFIALDTVDAEHIKDFLRHFDEDTGEFYSYGTTGADFQKMPPAEQVREGFTEIAGNVVATKFSDLFVKKKGRMSKAEAEGVADDKGVVGHVKLKDMSASTKKEIKAKLASYKKGFMPNTKISQSVAPISAAQAQANAAYNAAQAAKSAPKQTPFAQGQGGTPTQSSTPAQSATPTQSKTPSQPTQQQQQPKKNPNVIRFRKGAIPTREDLLEGLDDEEE